MTAAPHHARFADYAAQVVTSPYGQPAESSSSTTSTERSNLSTINSQLLTHGWAKRPLNLEALAERDYNEVVSVLFELLGSSVSNLTTLDTLAARHRTLEYEHERLTKNLVFLRNANGRMESEVQAWKSRCKDLEKRLGMSEDREKGLREEVARGRKALENVRIAASHEGKKVQIKLDKAQAQLAKITMDATLLTRPQGMILLNPVSGSKGHPEAPGHSPLLEQSLRDLADIRQSLQEETEAFRHVIVSTGNGLREALAAASGEEPPARLMHSQFFTYPSNSSSSTRQLTQTQSLTATYQSASSTSHPSIADIRLRALVSSIREKLAAPQTSQRPAESLYTPQIKEDEEGREKAEREKERIRKDLEEKVKDLEVEIICSKGREEEARRLVEEFAKVQMQSGSVRPIEEETGLDDEHLAENINKQKELLDAERKKFTEAALRLGQERRQLEAERQAFFEEQRKTDVETMLAFLPPTPVASTSANPDSLDPASPFLTDSTTERYLKSTAFASPHKPKAPSPLSPFHAKPRTPKSHISGKRRTAKTPLSRLVLEKAVRERGRETGILGVEGGRRTNSTVSSEGDGKGKSEDKHGKDTLSSSKSASSSRSSGSSDELRKSTMKPATKGLTTSQRVSGGLAASTNRKVVDLSKADGIGPKAAMRGSKVWR